jgi:putative hemolysin
LRELLARQVMVPRTRLVAASINSTVDALIDLACRAGFSRIPLYKKDIDNITGFVHIKDLFRQRLEGQQDPHQSLREVIYVPESLPIADVWTTLNSQGHYIAIVLDEYGGTAGLVTIEDLVEEIFGEVQDEFDDELPLISSDKEGRIHLRGDLLVTDVNEYLDLSLPDEEADTLGGLVFNELGRIPAIGDKVKTGMPAIAIRVEAMEGRSITEVSLLLAADTPPHVSEWEVGDSV